ncbi:RHS repeat-associated core domain-containing protein [Burkholderia sp. S-53]|uniref:RHS repeat-associated core domain-containing protein n=1 Tax=Burkholderia sp. S-53 TaxID=2906514 RepID=UPI0021CF1753|nr:RHS repeat-associated core domain-containing protein [Burkholderia sp. S-53]UXU85279.1 hypothetical protein LXM88_02600 [Burkholderia sp. S-53]
MSTISDDATARRCEGTPTLTVIDNRGLVVRTVQYNRTAIDDPLDELITRQSWSARGYLMTRIDPRLFDEQRLDPDVPPNFRYVRSLSGQPLTIASQDAGEQTALYDSDGGVVWQHDSRDQQLRRTYDTLHRLVSVTEQTGPATPRISERLLYGDATAADNANLRGQLRQAWSPAGMAETPSYSLAGQPLATVQQFLRDDVLDSDWASDDPARWTNALAPDTYTTRWAYNALGQELERTDARGNRQRQHYNVAGQLAGSDLQLAGQSTWQPLLRAISYSAAGQVLREEAGNGVVTDYTYEPQTQRLAELHTTRPPQAGRTTLLQALSYQYDPVGNLLAIDDAAKATRHTRNQRVAPASHYSYDALYQLTRATGRENANAGRQSQALPAPIVPLFQEIGELTPYTRTYRYDRGANLTTLQHQGTRSSYTQQMVVARTSNRAVPQTDGLTPGDVASYFDACGNLKALGASQPLAWDSRNQLQRTTQVVRRGLDDDTEVYWYDGAGQRATKLGTARTSGTTRTERVRYLPGLELRQIEQTRTGETLPTPVERLQVLTLGAAGRQSVRLLHWELGQPSTIENDQLRVSLDDQIGSSMLELDAQADILTWEEYYPFGGTSVWSARSDTEAKYKYVRYSGQERDATGLYYYGFRYYAPWLGRWLNPDPAGPVDGLNLFCMVANNPITYGDNSGLAPKRLVTAATMEEITREFVWECHVEAIGEASRKGRFAVSFRAAGVPTLAALSKGAAAKGHDILEKTIKPTSIVKAYPQTASAVLQVVQTAGIEGYVGHWSSDGLTGIYMSNDHGLGEQVQGRIYPIDLSRLEESLSALKAHPNWEALPLTGDYDTHDMITFRGAGRPRTVLADSSEEHHIIDRLNLAVSEVDVYRPFGNVEHHVVRHGPQVNFPSYMMRKELEDVRTRHGFLGTIAKPGEFPIAMVSQGTWSIIRDINELEAFYTRVGARIKETWKPGGSRNYTETLGGMAKFGRP